jgi:hypothetical protein
VSLYSVLTKFTVSNRGDRYSSEKPSEKSGKSSKNKQQQKSSTPPTIVAAGECSE